jgi:uncharacterized protein (TIGR00369 family)
MKIEDDKYCFVCGDNNESGLHAKFDVGPDNTSVGRIVIPSNFQGWKDIVHGGIISTLLDEASIYACRNISSKTVTAEITVKFKKPVPTGREVVLSAKVNEIKRKLVFVSAELKLEGEVYASAETKVFLL